MASAVIRSNRPEVTDRFPMLGFTVRTGTRPYFETVITTDPALLDGTKRDQRTSSTFWSSRGLGPLPAERGEAVFIVPDEVLRRFAGAERVFYAVATFADRTRNNPELGLLQPGALPSVTVSPAFAGRRTRQRVGGRGDAVRWTGAGGGYGANDQASLEWAGDAARPGVEPGAAPAGETPNDSGNGSGQAGTLGYDDGFGADLWRERTNGRSAARTRLFGDTTFDLGWTDVPMVPQMTNMSCWAAAAAMVAGWRDQQSIDPALLAAKAGFPLDPADLSGLRFADVDAFAKAIGLEAEQPQSYTVAAFRDLLQSRGPLWIGAANPAPHVVVATGIYGDGSPEGTYVRVNDPSSLPLPQSGPGQSLAGGGTQYVITYGKLVDAYESAARVPGVGIQILHVPEAAMKGRVPLVTAQAYAVQERVSRAKLFSKTQAVPAVVPIVSAIVGATMTRILNNEGDVEWELDQLKGLKYPGDDQARKGGDDFQKIVTKVAGWPKIESGLSDQIYADFEIEWQYNGHSVGNVAIKQTHANDAIAWGLKVHATINDDSTVYEGDIAALRVSFHYRFTRSLGSDAIAIRDFTLYANGTVSENSRWTQAPDGWSSTEQAVSRAQEGGGLIKEAISPIVETALKLLIDSAEGDLHYEIPHKLEGMKHVDDNKANAGPGPVRTQSFDHKLPWRTNGFGDEISLTFRVTFQYDGRSVGNVVIRRAGANDAVGWGLSVKGELLNDAGQYTDGKGGPNFAAIKLFFESTYNGPFGLVTKIALTDMTIYGNGDYGWKEEWTQD